MLLFLYQTEKSGLEQLHFRHVLVEKKYKYKDKQKEIKNQRYLKKFFREDSSEMLLFFKDINEYHKAHGIKPNCIGTRQKLSNYLTTLEENGYIYKPKKVRKVWRLRQKFFDRLRKLDMINAIKKFETNNNLMPEDLANSVQRHIFYHTEGFLSWTLYGLSPNDLKSFSRKKNEKFVSCLENINSNCYKMIDILNGEKDICFVYNYKKRDKIAKVAKVSHDTVAKVKK